MKLIIFGATGTLGRVLVQHAISAGHQVTAFTRSGEFPYLTHENLSVIQGDVLAPEAVAASIKGQEAVIVALGAGRKGHVRTAGTVNVIAGMRQHGVKRLLAQSTLGADDSKGHLNFFWKNIMFGMLLRPAMADHETQEKAVRKSDLEWTIVRPAAFTDGPATGHYQHGFARDYNKKLKLKISRADIADFFMAQLNSDRYLRQTPALSY